MQRPWRVARGILGEHRGNLVGASALGPHLGRYYRVMGFCLGVLVLLAGCGYHFAGSGGEAPGNIHSIAVEVLQNQTDELGLESLFTNALLDEFIRWKKLAVKPRAEADAVLSGRISGIKTEDVSHVRVEQTLETRLTVTLALTLKRRRSGEVLWQNQSLRYYEEYVEAGDALVTKKNRRQALEKIAKFLAERVHQSIFEGF